MANHPNLYELSGGGIHITYSTTGLQGQPHFTYHDAIQVKNFTGNQITAVQTSIGLLVTVTDPPDGRCGIDDVQRAASKRQSAGCAVRLREHHRGGHHDPAPVLDLSAFTGQTEFYTVTAMHGTAKHVVF